MRTRLQRTFSLLLLVVLSASAGAIGTLALVRPSSPTLSSQAAPTAGSVTVTTPTRVLPAPSPTPRSPAPTAIPTAQPAAVGSEGSFIERFDGAPAKPQAWNPPHWDVAVHSRDVDTWPQLEPMQASHGPACEPPPATHRVTAYEDTVYLCRDHLMTAINAEGYAVIYLTPNQLVDFSRREAVISWEMSTFRSSGRDWVDVWITPFEDNLQLPLEIDVDLSGPPRNAVHVRMDFNTNRFLATVYRNFVGTPLDVSGWEGYDAFLKPDMSRRDSFELRISQNRLRFGMPNYRYNWIDSPLPALGWSQGVVQLGHHSYNPTKDCTTPCGPNSWHWDNVQISPTVPFTMLKADRRIANPNTTQTVTFTGPSPANAFLRFSGIGGALEVSTDGGKTWKAATLQRQDPTFNKEEHFKSYWMPIAPGVRQVQFRGKDWYGGSWYVRDIALWAK